MKPFIAHIRKIRTFLILIALIIPISCNTSRVFKGGAAGAGAGGAIGGVIGAQSDNTAKGAIIGAAIGGTAGALIGKYMDRQAEELEEDLEGAEVERVGEGIKVTFDSGILFNFDSAELTPDARENVENLAQTLKEYEETNILIEGHTDSKGSDEYNMQLSRERAESVANALAKLGVRNIRMNEVGYGENQPVADNSTDQGRQQNRRVEVAIFANDELKEAAQEGDIEIE